MAETMRVVLHDFWSWLGTFLLVVAAAEGIGGLIRVTIKRED
jgi:hypothetical protein